MTMNLNVPEETLDVMRQGADEASVVSKANSNPDSKKKRSWKKPKDKPMRPLSAYNMFFQNQRERIVAGKTGDPTPEEIQQSVVKMLTSKTRGPKRRQDRISHGQISFGDLARAIAAKWKAIDPKLKAVYNHYAAQEKVRYKKEVVIWKEKKERELTAALAAKQNNLLVSSTSYNDSFVSTSSTITSMSTSYNESMNSHGGLSMSMQLNDEVIQRQQDILRQQMGFIDNRPHSRIGGGGNDSVSREVPKPELCGGGDAESQVFQFPHSYVGDGKANFMRVENSNTKTNGDPSRGGSLLDSNLQQQQQQQHLQQQHQHLQQQQQQFSQKEQLLLQLQQQQLQQLQHLQQARNETSRLSNMPTKTDTFLNCMQPSEMTARAQREFPPPSLTSQATSKVSNKQLLQDQFKELEHITFELDRLKDQERQMQQKIKEHQNMWGEDTAHGTSFNEAPPVNYNGSEFTHLNDTGTNFASVNSSLRSTFDRDIDNRQRTVMRSKSGDANLYGGHSVGSNAFNGASREMNGQRRQPRRHSTFGSAEGTGGNSGITSVSNSFNYGRNPSAGQQNQERRESLSAFLQLDDINNTDAIGKRQHDQQQQQQSHLHSLAALMQMQETQGNEADHHDIGSIFTMELGG